MSLRVGVCFPTTVQCCRRALYTSALLSAAGPIYLQTKPWQKKVIVDHDGVPIEAADDKPHDMTSRPKRKEPQWHQYTAMNMDRYSTIEELRRVRTDGGLALRRVPPKPKVKGYVPEPRHGMTVELFLKRIGRDCDKHVALFKSWEHLYASRGADLKERQVPLQDRKYILAWLERYRQGREPHLMSLSMKSKSNAALEWRQKLITQKAKLVELGLE